MDRLRHILEAGLHTDGNDRRHPLYPGAVALVMHDGRVSDHAVVGDAVSYGSGDEGPVPLPPDDRVAMALDTVFDVASVTKLFTAVTTLALADEGVLTLDAPVAPVLPEWADDLRGAITVRQLLTHTSGLPAGAPRLWELPSQAQRTAAVTSISPVRAPGTGFEYSCAGYIILGLLLERVTGSRLPRLVEHAILEPLGLADTAFRPGRRLAGRIAATEWQPHVGRGIVHGEVHDETSWSLGGTAGNAGLFSTATDLARFGEMLRCGGELDGVRVVDAESVRALATDQLPAHIDPGYRHGLGPRIGDASFMGALAGHRAYGHTGFTGTSLVVDPSLATVTVLLTNRVHPSREWSDVSAARRQVADLTAATVAQR